VLVLVLVFGVWCFVFGVQGLVCRVHGLRGATAVGFDAESEERIQSILGVSGVERIWHI
jgi:hypothetical protein